MNHVDHKPWRSTESGLWEALLEDEIKDSVLEEIKKELQHDFGIRPSDADERTTPQEDATDEAKPAESAQDIAPDAENASRQPDDSGAEAEATTVESMLEAIRKDLQDDVEEPTSDLREPEVLPMDAVHDAATEITQEEAQIDTELSSLDQDDPETLSTEADDATAVEEGQEALQNDADVRSLDLEEPETLSMEADDATALENDQDEFQNEAYVRSVDPHEPEMLSMDTADDTAAPETVQEEAQIVSDVSSSDLNVLDASLEATDEDFVQDAQEELQDDLHLAPSDSHEGDEMLQDALVEDVSSEHPIDVDASLSEHEAVEDTPQEVIADSVLEDIEQELQHDFDAALEPTDAAPEAAEMKTRDLPEEEEQQETTAKKTGDETAPGVVGKTIDGDMGPVTVREEKTENGSGGGDKGTSGKGGGGGGNNSGGKFHERLGPIDFSGSLKNGLQVVRRNMAAVMVFSTATNILVLAIPIYLFQISDRVLTSRSIDTLVMLTAVIVGAVILQVFFDAIRRFMLMRTAVEVAVQLGSPTLSAAARASLHGNGREYQILGDLQQFRAFLTSGTLISFLDGPFAPLFILAIFLIHPDLGLIVVGTALALLVVALINQRLTSKPFADANQHMSKANAHLDSMARNSQIINALAMISEAVDIWGKDTASSLKSQVRAQDWNIISATVSRGIRLLTQVGMLGWGAYLAIEGEITGGMVIAASIIAGRALAPIEGAIGGWNQFVLSRASYERIANLLKKSPLNFERLKLPDPEGRLDVERLLYVPPGTKSVILNSVHFSLLPGESLAIIGDSGAGKTTLGKMLVGSILPTSGCVRLDLMDLRNWDQRQFGENIGYLPQDVQLFPGTIKDNIARMRSDASDADIYEAAKLADVHEMIASMPLGYETVVAIDGSPLSGGQKQRVALARAFFGNPKLVVLDEPNSNLDALGDRALYNALAHAKKHKITMVAITQKPALLQYVDKILLLSNGTVSMFGYRNDVLKALAESQNSGRLGQGSS